ncbi:hypothetical protein Hypma_007005 [Hypsizygus marmoreus]|uniref:Uncharacterized protein n=1 Tax=Hypsizygus marmoreus TaxID=39966 RepID=A0A369KA54_HYPMA|nr:hypothetical protein Hypma_007005 [Hypsizygus marmoreus]
MFRLAHTDSARRWLQHTAHRPPKPTSMRSTIVVRRLTTAHEFVLCAEQLRRLLPIARYIQQTTVIVVRHVGYPSKPARSPSTRK